MNTYLLLKTLHILSSVLLVGTGLGSAFYMFFANRSGSVPAQAVVSRLVVRADWWFTTPCIFIQPITGLAMAYMAGYPLSTPWLALSLGLAALALAALLVRVARADRTYSEAEMDRITRILQARYGLGPFEASALRAQGLSM